MNTTGYFLVGSKFGGLTSQYCTLAAAAPTTVMLAGLLSSTVLNQAAFRGAQRLGGRRFSSTRARPRRGAQRSTPNDFPERTMLSPRVVESWELGPQQAPTAAELPPAFKIAPRVPESPGQQGQRCHENLLALMLRGSTQKFAPIFFPRVLRATVFAAVALAFDGRGRADGELPGTPSSSSHAIPAALRSRERK